MDMASNNDKEESKTKKSVPFSYEKTPTDYNNYAKNKRKKLFKDIKAQKRQRNEEKLIKDLEIVKEMRDEEENGEGEDGTTSCGRPYTISIALPGSILDNAQSLELRAYLGGQIARAAAIFNVDEIVIFDEGVQQDQDKSHFKGLLSAGRGNTQLFHILQYLECPQYLRKDFFPFHRDLSHAGLLNPLDMPHHLRESDWCKYREGVTLKNTTKDKSPLSYAKIGLKKDVLLDMEVPPGQRVTIKLAMSSRGGKYLKGKVVAPSEPREKCGMYWGYTSRLASSISDVFDSCPHEGGYDLLIGTSDKGTDSNTAELPSFRHAIVVFGGLKGLESCIEMDDKLTDREATDLFPHYLNVCPNQGSRTIRTEEAVLIAMTSLMPKLTSAANSTSTD